MKIDLAGPKSRGLAMGLNEFAGYFSVAIAAWATGYIAARHGLRPEPFYLGVIFLACGLLLSLFVVRETHGHAAHEAGSSQKPVEQLSNAAIFRLTSWKDRNLSSMTQAGLVNNLNDGLAWGLFPLIFAAAGLGLDDIGILAGLYPAVWGVTQLVTGGLSDKLGRKWLIAGGMWLQSIGIVAIALWWSYAGFAVGSVLLGLGTAMVYPTLLAAIGDVAHPSWRASAVGVYRLWRDLGYAFGAVIAGIVADLFGLGEAALVVAALTFMSGVIVSIRMTETHRRQA
jgi:MFS family permease